MVRSATTISFDRISRFRSYGGIQEDFPLSSQGGEYHGYAKTDGLSGGNAADLIGNHRRALEVAKVGPVVEGVLGGIVSVANGEDRRAGKGSGDSYSRSPRHVSTLKERGVWQKARIALDRLDWFSMVLGGAIVFVTVMLVDSSRVDRKDSYIEALVVSLNQLQGQLRQHKSINQALQDELAALQIVKGEMDGLPITESR